MTIKEDIKGIIKNNPPELCMNRNNPADTWDDYSMLIEALTTYITDKIEEAKCNRRPEGKCKECITQALIKELEGIRDYLKDPDMAVYLLIEHLDTRISQLKDMT